ncbi:MAG: anaerobic ribonucleoside-triphosphate reductase activating protein [Oscillospiraceae bacterium]|nr:anaerobic ribonucleoside-triphosphate reductase activating protein [Oscillospiraceae bacterium]
MRIGGLQKLTLLDYPGHIACTVFTAGCNFRCPFCHNSSLVLPEQFTAPIESEELMSFLRKRRGILDGVAITGGEPMLHADLPELLRQIKDLGFLVKLDTNGTFPDRLEAVIAEGLVDRVAMDVKNSPALYAETAGVPGLDLAAVDRSRALLMEGRVEYEFRTTVVRPLHTRESLIEAAQWIAGAKEYYLQQYKDPGSVLHSEGLGPYDETQMRDFAEAVRPWVPSVQLRGL